MIAKHGEFYTEDHRRFVKTNGPAVGVGMFVFLPTTATPLSPHVPAQALSDYNEAYLIRSLSPKASATLARHALQSIVRDYFSLPKLPTLHKELQAIEDRCGPDLYSAMMAMKSIGNIGAHPEQNAALMVDVEQGEPEALLDLIHLLDQKWYVARAKRAARVAKVKALGVDKASAKAGLPAATSHKMLPGGPST